MSWQEEECMTKVMPWISTGKFTLLSGEKRYPFVAEKHAIKLFPNNTLCCSLASVQSPYKDAQICCVLTKIFQSNFNSHAFAILT
jgi:hypothetical protein